MSTLVISSLSLKQEQSLLSRIPPAKHSGSSSGCWAKAMARRAERTRKNFMVDCGRADDAPWKREGRIYTPFSPTTCHDISWGIIVSNWHLHDKKTWVIFTTALANVGITCKKGSDTQTKRCAKKQKCTVIITNKQLNKGQEIMYNNKYCWIMDWWKNEIHTGNITITEKNIFYTRNNFQILLFSTERYCT